MSSRRSAALAAEGYTNITAMPGGHSEELFSAIVEADGSECVLRIYGVGTRNRGPEAPEVEAGVLKLARGLLPVPEVVEVRRRRPRTRYGGLLAVTRLPGIQIAELLGHRHLGARHAIDAAPELQRRVGSSMGALLGRMASMAFIGPGCFMDAKLRMGPWEEGSESLLTWLDLHYPDSELTTLSPGQLAAVRRLAELGDNLLAVSLRAVLVHGDLSVRNALADPETAQVSGIIDWEFAHAGHPVEDLGKMLRDTLGSPYADAVTEETNRWLPAAEQTDTRSLQERARAADLYWIIENASRHGTSGATDRCWELLVEMAESGSLLPEFA